jgi:hypothetical protein
MDPDMAFAQHAIATRYAVDSNMPFAQHAGTIKGLAMHAGPDLACPRNRFLR